MTTETKTTENATPVPTPPQSKTVQTDHTVTIQGKPIAYTATAGTYILNPLNWSFAWTASAR